MLFMCDSIHCQTQRGHMSCMLEMVSSDTYPGPVGGNEFACGHNVLSSFIVKCFEHYLLLNCFCASLYPSYDLSCAIQHAPRATRRMMVSEMLKKYCSTQCPHATMRIDTVCTNCRVRLEALEAIQRVDTRKSNHNAAAPHQRDA